MNTCEEIHLQNPTMKVIFMVNITPNIEMFAPIVKELPNNSDVLFINTDKWQRRAEIEQKLQGLSLKYQTFGSRSYRNINRILDEFRPDALVLCGDAISPLYQMSISCANSKNIPTLSILHGIMALEAKRNPKAIATYAWISYLKNLWLGIHTMVQPDRFSWHRLFETGWFWMRYGFRYRPKLEGHGGCSKIAVFGNADKQLLVSEGIAPERIAVTGNPKFDYIASANKNDCKSKVCRRFGISADTKIILLLTDWFVEYGIWTVRQREQFVKAVCRAASKLPRCKIVIKLHPLMEKQTDYEEIVKDFSEPPIICQNVPLWELVHACSLAITVSSTAGIEAMAADKPLIIFNLFNEPSIFDEKSGVVIVRTEADLLPALEAILYQGLSKETKEAASKFVHRHAYVQDGKAARRIADLIVKMVTENQDRSLA